MKFIQQKIQHMKKFKIIDFWINVILIIAGFILIIYLYRLNRHDNKIAILLPSFFWGIWQVISMIVHVFNRKNWKYFIVRVSYNILSAIVLIYSFTIDFDHYPHTNLLPLMAIFYTCLCGFEVYSIKKVNNEKV
jgi:hypothetical protein